MLMRRNLRNTLARSGIQVFHIAYLPQNRRGLDLGAGYLMEDGRVMCYLRAFQLTHGYPRAQGGKPGGGLRLGYETVESP